MKSEHTKVAELLAVLVKTRKADKTILAIGGESGSGKSEITESLREALRTDGYRIKILHLDNYYKVPPHHRNDHRRKHGMPAVGLHEIDWERLDYNIEAFYNGSQTIIPFIDLYTEQEDQLITNFREIDVLLVEGLYSCHYPADIGVFIDLTYHETMNAQIVRRKEKVNDFRFSVLEKEHQEVLNTRSGADYFVTSDFTLVKGPQNYSERLHSNEAPFINTLSQNEHKTDRINHYH